MNLIHRVGSIKPLNEDTFLMTIESAEIAAAGLPGQFVNVRCGGPDAYLRRPFSLCRVHRDQGIRYRCPDKRQGDPGIVPYA